MLDWMKARGRTVMANASAPVELVHEVRAYAGEYRFLYKYLRDRYADRVVLTFAEIEDLQGAPLPAAARLELDWWASAEPKGARSAQADAWMRANRTAKVNLAAASVMFEREDSA